MSKKEFIEKTLKKTLRKLKPHRPDGLRPFHEVPGPRALPLIGSTWKYFFPHRDQYDPTRLHLAAEQKFSRYGPLVRETLPGVRGPGLLSVFDPDDVASFLRQTGARPDRRSHLALQKYRRDRPHLYSSGGLLPSNGDEWLSLRQGSQTVFGRTDRVLGHLPGVDKVVRDFVALLRELRRPDHTVDDLLYRIMTMNLEVLALVLLGERLGCLKEVLPDSCEALMKAGGRSTQAIFNTDNGPLQLYRYIDTPLYRQLRDSQDLIYSVAKCHYDRKKQTRGTQSSSDPPTSVLEQLMDCPGLTEREVMGLMCDAFMAGVDTTSFTLSFALYHLARNPAVQGRLADEAHALLAASGGKVTGAVLADARYTVATLKESLRLNPVSIGIGRVNTVRPIELRGYHIPAGTTIVSMNQHIGRNSAYFENPLEFCPERFLDRTKKHHSFALLPFGQGGRKCIAQHIAKQTLHTSLLHLVHSFNFSWHGPPLDCRVRLINEPDGPLCHRLHDRKWRAEQ